MTRDEHMAWAKQRALEYLDRDGDAEQAVTSMLSDLSKHEETRRVGENMGRYGVLFASRHVNEARRFIEGFR